MKESVAFTQADSVHMMTFEKEIAYFYGAEDTELIGENYLNALVELEKLGIQSEEAALEEAMIPHLKAAYRNVKNQTALAFNVHRAQRPTNSGLL